MLVRALPPPCANDARKVGRHGQSASVMSSIAACGVPLPVPVRTQAFTRASRAASTTHSHSHGSIPSGTQHSHVS